MLAVVGMLVQEVAHPLFENGGKDLGPAIYHMQAVQNYFAAAPLLLLIIVGIFEGNNIFGASSAYCLPHFRPVPFMSTPLSFIIA